MDLFAHYIVTIPVIIDTWPFFHSWGNECWGFLKTGAGEVLSLKLRDMDTGTRARKDLDVDVDNQDIDVYLWFYKYNLSEERWELSQVGLYKKRSDSTPVVHGPVPISPQALNNSKAGSAAWFKQQHDDIVRVPSVPSTRRDFDQEKLFHIKKEYSIHSEFEACILQVVRELQTNEASAIESALPWVRPSVLGPQLASALTGVQEPLVDQTQSSRLPDDLANKSVAPQASGNLLQHVIAAQQAAEVKDIQNRDQ